MSNDKSGAAMFVTNGTVALGEHKQKDMMAELIKQQTKMNPLKKERIFKYEHKSIEHPAREADKYDNWCRGGNSGI